MTDNKITPPADEEMNSGEKSNFFKKLAQFRNKYDFIFKKLAQIWNKYSYIFVFLIILLVYAITITSGGHTFKFRHISNLFSNQNTVIVGTMAIGMALVIITGQIDLSLGSALVLCTGVTIVTYNITEGNVILMILAALGSGLVCGLINGLFVGLAKMPAFIVTLGTMLIYRSVALSVVGEIDPALTGAGSKFMLNSEFESYVPLYNGFGSNSLKLGSFQIPYVAFLFAALIVLFIFIMAKTKYGKSIYAVGSNEKTARLTGINVDGVKISVFAVTGLLVGVASFIQACKIGSVFPASSGVSYEMYAIAAVVLGGVNMAGGKGKILGVLFGVLSYTTINTIIVSSGLTPNIQNAIQGLVLIAVIFVQTAGPVIKTQIAAWRKRAKSTPGVSPTGVLVFGILSLCLSTVPGFIFGILAMVKGKRYYAEGGVPDGKVKAGKIMGTVGWILSLVTLLISAACLIPYIIAIVAAANSGLL